LTDVVFFGGAGSVCARNAALGENIKTTAVDAQSTARCVFMRLFLCEIAAEIGGVFANNFVIIGKNSITFLKSNTIIDENSLLLARNTNQPAPFSLTTKSRGMFSPAFALRLWQSPSPGSLEARLPLP